MNNNINAAFNIFSKYIPPDAEWSLPPHVSSLYVYVSPDIVREHDLQYLRRLGFIPSQSPPDCFEYIGSLHDDRH